VSAIESLDLATAWKRMKADRPHRTFVSHPHLFGVIDTDVEGWFGTIRDRGDKLFAPAESALLEIPKPNWLVRPAHIVTHDDELLYTAIVGAFHGPIHDRIKWSQGTKDIAYRLASPSKTPHWVKSGFNIWEEWRVKSLAAITSDVFYVLETDVTGFYENIDHKRLHSDLKSLAVPDELLNGLMTYLGRWAGPRGKGIPQGYSASDVLAKLYMDPVDRGLRSVGFSHLRYVDDFRVFCRSMREAKQALLKLNELVRIRGLNLQSGKTKILSADQARHVIDGVAPTIKAITAEIARELKELGGGGLIYGTLQDLERYLARNPDGHPPEILERAFTENFLLTGDGFNKTMFHYLLARLGRVQSTVAVDYCRRQLAARPEETRYILRYLGSLPADPMTHDAILALMESPDAIYEYQLFELVRWFYSVSTYPDRLLRLCRTWAGDMNKPACLRGFARAVLGEAAFPDDLDLLESECSKATTVVDKADLIISLFRMEVSRRNTVLGRFKGDGFLVQRAIEYAKKLSSQAGEGSHYFPYSSDMNEEGE